MTTAATMAPERRVKFYKTATDYLLYEGREALCEGVTRSAKTFSLMYKAHATATNYPGSRQLIARQTRKSLNESVLKDWRDEILMPGHPAISTTASREHQDLYVYPNKSEVYFLGLETMNDTSSPILSTKWDRIGIVQAEGTNEGAWQTLATRLSSFKTPYHQLTADCNPAQPSHWLNKRFAPQHIGQHRQRFRFRLWDNPYFYEGVHPDGQYTREGQEYKDIQESVLTPGTVYYKRFVQGLWSVADNTILENWDPDRHCVDTELEHDEQYGWVLHVKGWEQPVRIAYFTAGVDWGWDPDPGVISVWAYDSPRWHPLIRRFRIVEVMKTKWLRTEWGDIALDLWDKYGIQNFSCDRSNPEGIQYFNLLIGKKIGRQFATVAKKCPPLGGGHRADKDKGTQIDLMREGLGYPGKHQRTYLSNQSFIEGHDENLRRMGLPTCYEQEIEGWCYEQKPNESLHEPKPARGSRDDALDAARYDETFNFARGFGQELREPSTHPPGSIGWEQEQYLQEKRRGKRRA